MFNFSRSIKNKIIAVFDISSASVGGAIFQLSKNGDKIKVFGTVRKPINFLFDVDFNASLRCTLDALNQVIKKMLEFYPSGPEAIMCVFSSPWFVSQMKIINVEKDQSFEITESFLNKLINEEEKKISKEQKNSKLIEHEMVKTELNGYAIKSPFGKKAKSLRTWIYISFAASKAVDEAKKEFLKNFGTASLLFKTFPLVVSNSLNDIIKSGENFGLVDISGEVTDIFLFRNNYLEETITLPRGANLLYRNIASDLGTFIKETPSILRSYYKEHRSAESSEKIFSAISKSEEEWNDFLKKSFEASSGKKLLPQNFYFTGNEIISSFFLKRAAKNDFSKFTVLGKQINFKKIHPGLLTHYFEINAANKVSLENDINLMFEIFYANKNFKS